MGTNYKMIDSWKGMGYPERKAEAGHDLET